MTPEELAWSFVSKVCELQCSERENCTCFNEIAQAIRSAEQARDERAAKIAETMGIKMRERYSERDCEEVGDEIAAAIRAPDTTPAMEV